MDQLDFWETNWNEESKKIAAREESKAIHVDCIEDPQTQSSECSDARGVSSVSDHFRAVTKMVSAKK